MFLVSTNSKSVISDIAKEYSNSLVNKTVQKSFREFTKGKIDKYDKWKNITLNFDPKSVIGY